MLGAAWMEAFGWDGKFPTLESVAFTPLSAAANMGRNEQELLRDIAQNAAYRAISTGSFRAKGVSRATVERALATYERTIVPARRRSTAGSPATRPRFRRPPNAASTCSPGGRNAANATPPGASPTIPSMTSAPAATTDLGRGRLFPKSQALQHAFKVPTLRDVAKRAPYMHDGSLPTLEGRDRAV